jgi:hypothetical protein
MVMLLTTDPLLLTNRAPIDETSPPPAILPRARSPEPTAPKLQIPWLLAEPSPSRKAALAWVPLTRRNAHPFIEPGVVVGRSKGPEPVKENVPVLGNVSKFWK